MRSEPPHIRPYSDVDQQSVRELFIKVNRELAPPKLRADFERYIARSLRDEIDQISAYYRDRSGSFWVAECLGVIVGMFGLERATTMDGSAAMELRRMYVAREARGRGVGRGMLRYAECIVSKSDSPILVLSTSELQGDALALYRGAGYELVREEISVVPSHKTVGAGLTRYYFEKRLDPPA
jgi:GNAT superfamily N-acetyltransferase